MALSVLDQATQTAANTSTPATVPDPTTVPPPAPPTAAQAAAVAGALPPTTPPGVVVPPMNAPGGAASQVLTMAAGANKAATAQVQNSPYVKLFLDEKAKTDAANATAATQVQANLAKIQSMDAEADPARVPVPRLHDLTPVTEDPAYAKAAKADPLRVLGQYLPILAAFGAMTTSSPATAALNAATAAVNAAKADDKEALAKAHADWLDNTKMAVENNANLTAQYKEMLEDRKDTMAERMAKVQALMAENKDAIGLAALRSGNPEGILKIGEMTNEAGKNLMAVTIEAQRSAESAAVARDTSARDWLNTKIAGLNAQTAAGKTSPNDIAGQLYSKAMALGGYDKLSDPEKDMVQRLQQYEAGLHPTPMGSFADIIKNGAAAGSVTPPAGAIPAPTGDPGTLVTSVAPSQPVTAAMPTAVVTAAPQNQKARVVGKVYGTPRGPLQWTAAGWVPPPQ